VFNGGIGQVVRIDPDERELASRLEEREVLYDFNELDEVSLAYAIRILNSGIGIPRRGRASGHAALPPVAAEPGLHRNDAGGGDSWFSSAKETCSQSPFATIVPRKDFQAYPNLTTASHGGWLVATSGKRESGPN
jgi:hypothetical protein